MIKGRLESEETAAFFQKVYGWMCFALLLSALAAYLVVSSEALFNIILGTPYLIFILIILELVVVVWISGWIQKMSATLAKVLFILYALLTGITLSVIFLVYTIESISLTFLATAGMFGIMSFYGFVTKRDLTNWGAVLFMGLIGIILASVVNLFLGNSNLDIAISIIGVIIFTGLTAYDVQKIKEHNIIGNDGTDEDTKESILGALRLYLDFINLFLQLLKFMGKRR